MRHPTRQRFARRAIATVLLPLLAGLGATSDAAVGTKIIVQGWEPWNDNRQPTTVPIDDPQFISGPLMAAWTQVQGPLCDAMKATLSRPDLVRPGITLYNIGCQFNALDVKLRPLSQTRAKFIVSLPSSRIAATSTTPSLAQLGADAPLIGAISLPGATDPRFSVTLDAQVELDVEIGDAPAPLFTVRRARFVLKRADARGENITGKLGEWVASKVVPFFGGPNFEALAESRINGVEFSALRPLQQALKAVNDRVAPYAQYVRVGTWMSSSRIALAFQPRSLAAPALAGEMRGTLSDRRIGMAQVDHRDLCRGFQVTAQYQAAPRPLLDPDRLDDLGPARMVPVGSMQPLQMQPDGSCAYMVRGLAVGVTNIVQPSHPLAGRGSSGSLIRVSTVLLHPGWDGRSVKPRNVESGRNYVLASDLRGSLPVVQREPRRRVVDPLINYFVPKRQADAIGPKSKIVFALEQHALNPQPVPPHLATSDLTAASAMRTKTAAPGSVAAIGATTIGAAQALNPQPLPPKSELSGPMLTVNKNVGVKIDSSATSLSKARLSFLH